MDRMNRREFMVRSAVAAGSVFGGNILGQETAPASRPVAVKPLAADDIVTLGKSGIQVSRLTIGTGMNGGRESREMGEAGMVKLLRHALDRGINGWDTADMYQTHGYVKSALQEIRRSQVVMVSKVRSTTADEVRADIERFFLELNTDYIDIMLLHCVKEGDWPQAMKGPMDVLSEYKARGRVRMVGVSCHGLAPLLAAAEEPWVEYVLARVNPFAHAMDVDKPERVSAVVHVLEKMHQHGQVVQGMKIFGAGGCKTAEQKHESLRFALNQPYLSGFTIGLSRIDHLDEVVGWIERLRVVPHA
ncbi:MAG: aldo/keto reductase [Phycisphaerales bacterium]|nr:aldo/keto reductase [Phycisphaerales bacterium]